MCGSADVATAMVRDRVKVRVRIRVRNGVRRWFN